MVNQVWLIFNSNKLINLDEVVAIKVIDMKGVRDSVGKQMLDCEIQALKTLKHPNILKCFDVFSTQNNCYIITQFCDEGDLASHLQRKKKFAQHQTLNLLRDISAGFIEMASNQYLHRDIKLANIFVNKGVAKLADFGFAKKNKNPGQKQKYNVGSPLYMSPQALKKNIYSIKNDIWSMGIIIYEMLHGQTPWQCRTEKQLMDKMVRIPVKFSSSIKISEELKQLIKKCLQVDESKRYGLEDIKQNSLIKKLLNEKNQVKQLKEQKNIMIPKQNINMDNKPPKTSQTQRMKSERNRLESNKQNIQGFKNIVQKNNLIVVHYMNIFRLLYKIVQQLKIHKPQEKQLIQILSNQVIIKVNQMNQAICNQKNAYLPQLKQTQKYLNQISNPNIKKYKTVISEYHKKYTDQLNHKNNNTSYPDFKQKIKQFLKRTSPVNQKECILYHWLIQYVLLKDQPKKSVVEGIIEAQAKPKLQNIRARLKLI